MKKQILFLFALIASVAWGYNETIVQVYCEAGYSKIRLSKDVSPLKMEGDLRFSSPRLDGRLKLLSFVFIPENDGTVGVRFGPNNRDGDIPSYYSDIRVNGVLIDGGNWSFYEPSMEMGRTGAVISSPGKPVCLRVSIPHGAYTFIKVKKGVRTELSMQGQSGSVLEAFKDQLSIATENLTDAANASGVRHSGVQSKVGKSLVENLNALLALSEKHLRVVVPALPSSAEAPETRIAKVAELSKAYEDKEVRDGATLCLYDRPEICSEIKNKIAEVIHLSAKFKTESLLAFMLETHK